MIEKDVHTSSVLPVPLFSFDDMYATGKWDFCMRDESRGGPAFVKYGNNGEIEHNVPLEYDWENKCTWVNYSVGKNKDKVDKKGGRGGKSNHKNLLNCVNVLPSIKEIYNDLLSSELVECLTHVNNIGESDDFNLSGAKRGLRSDLKKMSLLEFHSSHGHLGSGGGGKACEICMRKRGNKISLRSPDRTPFKDYRPGFRWYLDAICWGEENGDGERYTFSMRDCCTGTFKTFNTSERSDFPEVFERWVKSVRASPYTMHWGHTMVGEVHTDFDGVFREDNKEFMKMVGGLGIKFSYLPPEHHEGPGERQVGVMEETTKALLMERNLPAKHWGECVKAAEFLLNRYALSHDSLSSDGDAPRPLERLTGGRYSRRRIDKELGYYLGPGTLALVHDNRVKGSNVGAKTRFGAACGMEGDVVLFKCPYNKRTFRSKSYTVIQLPNYINFYQFLSITQPESKHSNSHIRPKDFKIRVAEGSILSHLPSTRAWEGDRLRDIKFLDRINYEEEESDEGGGGFDGREYVLTGEPPKPGDLVVKKGNGIRNNEGGEGGTKSLPQTHPHAGTERKRVKENTSYKLELKAGSLPQTDYELKGEGYVGRMISKDFGGETFRGIVVGSDIDNKNGDELWVIEYEDGDGEDLTQGELMDVLVAEDDDECPIAGWVNCWKDFGGEGGRRKRKGKGRREKERRKGKEEKKKIGGSSPVSQVPARVVCCARGTTTEQGGLSPSGKFGQGVPHSIANCLGGKIYQAQNSPTNTGDKGEGGEPLQQEGGGTNHSPEPHNYPHYITTGTENFQEVCRRLTVDKYHFRTYYDALPVDLKLQFRFPFIKGDKKKEKLRGGMVFPHPEGMVRFKEGRQGYYRNNDIATPVRLIREAIRSVEVEACRRKGRGKEKELRVLMVEKSTGKVVAPSKVQEAYDRDDFQLWVECWDEEMGKLENAGHITHGHTRGEILKMGITSPPVSTRMISDAKYKGHQFDKRKGRLIVQGFKQQVGIHYDGKVFTPSPSQYTQKILMALVAGRSLQVKSWDIGQAYTHGERVKPIALSYPVGFKRRGGNGEELFMIAHRQHYGEKGAGRGWGITRTTKIKEMYNTQEYSCHVCASDPCLNVVVKWGKGGKPKGVSQVVIRNVVAGHGVREGVPKGSPPDSQTNSTPPRPPPSLLFCENEKTEHDHKKETKPQNDEMPPANISYDMKRATVSHTKTSCEGASASRGKANQGFQWKTSPGDAVFFENLLLQNSADATGAHQNQADIGPTPDGNSLPIPMYATVVEVASWGGVVSYLSVYTDDIDYVGPDEGILEEIYQTMNRVWPSREVDSGFMLGMKREIYEEGGVRKVRMSQPDFIEAAFEEFALYTNPYTQERKKLPSTPLPPGIFLSKLNSGKDKEEIKAVQDMGYMSLCGKLIWACRGSFPETAFAVSQVCKLMSCPSFKVFELGIQVLAYMYRVRHRGIVFRSDGNPEPIILSDASFKIDPFSGKTQYGIHVLLYGGPIVVVSKKYHTYRYLPRMQNYAP